MKDDNKNEILATLHLLENNLEIAEYTINAARKLQSNLIELLKVQEEYKIDHEYKTDQE